jgi:hypothetical protein
MTPKFESECGSIDCGKRLEALMGPDEKDTTTGSVVGVGETALIGAQKAGIEEQPIDLEG